jgi:IS30 family transposase
MGHLTLEQRYKIELGLQMGKSQYAISQELGRSRSVISREIKRNRDGRSGEYRADLASRKAIRRHKIKRKRRDLTPALVSKIQQGLSLEHSPEQIVGQAKIEGAKMVSIETIYKYIWKNKKQGGKWYKCLRNGGKRYQNRANIKDRRGVIADRVGIEKRPLIVEQKERFGDLEIDLIIGKNHKEALLTINDRATGMLFMDKVASKTAAEIETKATELLADWQPLIHTITSDNGKEFANHKNIAQTLQIDFYFALPYHSWQRGANENLNGLVRQYFPKKSSFKAITKEQIQQVVHRINNRPRKRFRFLTPLQVLAKKLDKISNVAFIY